MNVLVLGSGGREHAITWALAKSSQVNKLFVAPGNGGTAQLATNVTDLAVNNTEALIAFCHAQAVTLVVVGPEAPLVAGVADALRAVNIDVFGPDAFGAQLEGSKTFSKRFMDANGIPTARYESFTDADAAIIFARELGAPVVVKADGLAAGKGVVVAETLSAAEEAIRACFDGAFGSAGSTVIVEECLRGPECSLLAFVAKGKAICMAPAQDHKRVFEGDCGPNTGGMGVYSPVPIVSDEEHAAMKRIMDQAAAATVCEPFPMDYRGVLYGGFILTNDGPKVLEFNVRFGDPETQVILPRLQGDVAEIMRAVAQGKLDEVQLSWSDTWAVCVVLASAGYPGSYETGKPIFGLDSACALDGVEIFHAGTAVNDSGELVSAGGRVLNVVALGDSFAAAQKRAYEACDLISFEGKQLRTDIGAKALAGRSSWN